MSDQVVMDTEKNNNKIIESNLTNDDDIEE